MQLLVLRQFVVSARGRGMPEITNHGKLFFRQKPLPAGGLPAPLWVPTRHGAAPFQSSGEYSDLRARYAGNHKSWQAFFSTKTTAGRWLTRTALGPYASRGSPVSIIRGIFRSEGEVCRKSQIMASFFFDKNHCRPVAYPHRFGSLRVTGQPRFNHQGNIPI